MTARQQQFIAIDVANLEAMLADMLAAYPEMAEDEDLRRDMIEGETNAFDLLERIVGMERDAHHQAEAIKARVSDLQSRKSRAERRKDAMRGLAFKVLKAAGLPKASLTEATLSISKKSAGVEIVDAGELPEWAVRIMREPNKTAIKEALNDNKEVPGARMGEAGETLTVRVA